LVRLSWVVARRWGLLVEVAVAAAIDSTLHKLPLPPRHRLPL
jgi:hypothetical protein